MTLNELCRVRLTDINQSELHTARLVILKDYYALYECAEDLEMTITSKEPVKMFPLVTGEDDEIGKVFAWAYKHDITILNHVFEA